MGDGGGERALGEGETHDIMTNGPYIGHKTNGGHVAGSQRHNQSKYG